MSGRIHHLRRSAASWFVAAVVLAPFATTALEFRSSLRVQAGLLVAIVAVAALMSLRASKPRWDELPAGIRWGLVLYLSATFLGTFQGLVLHTPSEPLLGQVVALLLLPLAAIPGLGRASGMQPRQFWIGLFVGTTAGASVQLVWGTWQLLTSETPTRFFLTNSVSVVGVGLLAIAGGVAGWRHSDHRLRVWSRASTVVVGSLVLASSLRSLWILAPLTALLTILTCHGLTMRRTVSVASAAVVALGGVIAAAAGAEAWLAGTTADWEEVALDSTFGPDHHRMDGILVESDGPVVRGRTPIDSERAPAWLVAVTARGEGRGTAVLRFLPTDPSGQRLSRLSVHLPAGLEEQTYAGVVTSPQGATQAVVELRTWDRAHGQWVMTELRLRAIPNTWLAALVGQYLHLRHRVAAPLRALRADDRLLDPTVSFRIVESQRVLAAWHDASWSRKLFGSGLGALVELDVDGFDNRGNWIHYDSVNYLHNWYLFLLYKLGVVGGAAMLAAFLWWVVWGFKTALRSSSETRWVFAATGSALAVHLVWSVTSPELLDFRFTPVWGWLLASAVSAWREGGEADER